MNHLSNILQENSKMKPLFCHLPEIVYWKDKKGRYLNINNISISRHGLPHLSASDVIGKTDYDLFSKKIADEYRANDLEAMKEEKEIVREEMAYTLEGNKIFQLSSKKPLYNHQGRIIGTIGLTMDITQFKENLALRDKNLENINKTKIELINDMRQNLITSFNHLTWLLDHLKFLTTREEKKEAFDFMAQDIRTLLDQLNRLLNLKNSNVLNQAFNY